MEDRQIDKWLCRKFRGTGWLLLAYYLLMNVLVMAALLGDMVVQVLRGVAAGDYMSAMDASGLTGNAWGYVVTVAVGLTVLYAWKGWDHWKQELFRKEKSMTAGAFLALLCLCCGSQMANSLWVNLLERVMNLFDKSVVELLESVSGSSDTFSMFFYSALVAPVAEELIFRGYILRHLRPYGKRFAILASAFLFGMFHGNLLQTPYAFAVGLVLGYAAMEYSIWWAIALHTINNLVLADLFSRLLALLPTGTADVVSLGLFGGCAVISIVLLIVKRRDVRGYHQSEWMDRRCVRCFFGNSGVIALTAFMVLNMLLMLAV